MRFQTWRIPRIQLYLFAMLPLLTWALFRLAVESELSAQAVFLYYRNLIWIWGGVWFVLSLIWIYLFRRGWFKARYVGYAFWAAEFLIELTQSVQARNLWFLFASLIYFALMLALYRWLEAAVESATMNPKMYWFEGNPKPLPRVQAFVRLRPDSEWVGAKLRRIDAKGLFLLLDQNVPTTEVKPGRVIEFRLQNRNHEATGVGEVLSCLLHENGDRAGSQASGIGLLFLPKDLYHLTEYTALYEAARGEGYVF